MPKAWSGGEPGRCVGGAVTVEAEAGRDDGDGESFGVVVPADRGHDRRGGKDSAECPQVDPSGTRVASGCLRAVTASAPRSQRSARTGCSRQAPPRDRSRIGIGRPKISLLNVMISLDHQTHHVGVSHCRDAANNAGEADGKGDDHQRSCRAPDTMTMVIMVRSMISTAWRWRWWLPRHGAGRFQAASALAAGRGERAACGGDRDDDQRDDGDGRQERDQAGAPRAWMKQEQPPDSTSGPVAMNQAMVRRAYAVASSPPNASATAHGFRTARSLPRPPVGC